MALFLSAFQLVIRRSLANWKLLSSIVVGVLVAVALVSSTPFYSNALDDLGLAHALYAKAVKLVNVDVYVGNQRIDSEDYNAWWQYIEDQATRNISSLVRERERWIKTATFRAAWADRPTPTGPGSPIGHFHVFTNLEEHVVLLDGRYPDPLPLGLSDEDLVEPGLEIEALIGSDAAEMFDVETGDRLLFSAGSSIPPEQITIKLTGIIDPTDPNDEFWFGETDIFYVPQEDQGDPMTAPLFIPEQTLFEGISRIISYPSASYHWYYFIDPTDITSENAKSVRPRVESMQRQIINEIPNSTVMTGVGNIIAEYQQKLMFTQIPLFLLIFQIVAIVLYYLITVANMLIEQQTGDIALLRSRGANTFQVIGVFFIEGVLISAIGGAAGPFLGAFVFSFLGKTAPFIPLTGGELLPIRFTGMVFTLAAGGAALCLFAIMMPAIQAARESVVHQRQHAARPPTRPFWQRYYLDIFLLLVGGMLYYQMQQQGTLITTQQFGGMEIDWLMMLTPMLFMLAVAIIFLRVYPWIIALLAKISSYVSNAALVLGLRYMARNPIHYGRLILLLMMTASVGMFSASFMGTLDRSYSDRIMYAVGSDIRLENFGQWSTGKENLAERYLNVDGVEDISIAYRETGYWGGTYDRVGFNLLALDPESFQRVAWYREDFSELSFSELMDSLAEDQTLEEGLALPEGAETIGVWVRPAQANPNARIMVRIKDGLDRYFDYELGSPGFEGWQYLEANLSDLAYYTVVPPINLSSIFVRATTSGRGPISNRTVYLDDLQVQGSLLSQPVVLEDFEDISEWSTMWLSTSTSSRSTDSFARATSLDLVHSGSASLKFTWGDLGSGAHGGLFPNLNSEPLSLIVSQSFMDRTEMKIGRIIEIRLPGQFLPAKIIDVVEYFPTLDPAETPFIIANLDRMTEVRNFLLGGFSRIYPNEAWLTVTEDPEDRDMVLDALNSGILRPRLIYDRTEMIETSEADPLVAAGWGGILLIAFLGVILISGLGFVVYAYLSARGRQLEFAILRTQGFSLGQIIGLISFEQIFVIGAGMGIGTVVGQQLSTVMMPFLQLTERGARVLPPFLPVIDWNTIGLAYIILTVAFIITMSLVVLFFSRVAIHRTLRIGEQ